MEFNVSGYLLTLSHTHTQTHTYTHKGGTASETVVFILLVI